MYNKSANVTALGDIKKAKATFKHVNAIVMCLIVETAALTTDISVLISAGTTNATL